MDCLTHVDAHKGRSLASIESRRWSTTMCFRKQEASCLAAFSFGDTQIQASRLRFILGPHITTG